MPPTFGVSEVAAVLALKHKETGNVACGRGLIEVDEDMCKVVGVEPDDVTFYKEWVDTVGFGLAVGRTYNEIRENFPDHGDVIDYLETYYDNDSFRDR